MARTDPVGQPKAKNRATGIKVSRIAFVDEPAVPGARFVVVKRRESEEHSLKYSDDQPRVPAGAPEGGQFESGGGSGGSVGGVLGGSQTDKLLPPIPATLPTSETRITWKPLGAKSGETLEATLAPRGDGHMLTYQVNVARELEQNGRPATGTSAQSPISIQVGVAPGKGYVAQLTSKDQQPLTLRGEGDLKAGLAAVGASLVGYAQNTPISYRSGMIGGNAVPATIVSPSGGGELLRFRAAKMASLGRKEVMAELFGNEPVMKAAPMKTDGGVAYGKDAYLYTPDDEPSHWKLRIKEVVDGEQKVTRAQLGRAAAALGPSGFRGQKVDIPSEDIAKVKAKLRGLYKELGVKPEDIPEQVQKCDSCGGMMPQSLDDDDDDEGGEQKDRATVNYRLGGGFDTDDDGIVDQCGSCDFFIGPMNLTQDQVSVGDCSLVHGDIGSNMLCDLYEVADAFSLVEKAKRLEAVTKEGRMLSAANLEKMKAAMQAAKDAIDTMQGMMDAAAPKAEKRADLTPEERATLDRIRTSLESR